MYITPAQLAEIPGATELAQSAGPEHGVVIDPALMDLTLRGGDRAAFGAEEVAAADAALIRIQTAIEWAGEFIDGYIRRRVSLPLSSVPLMLLRVARHLVRYDLHKTLIGDDKDPIIRDYRGAVALLGAIRDGKVAIGAEDPLDASAGSVGEVRFESSPPVFGRSSGVR